MPPALSLDGGVWDSGRADVQHFMAAVTEHSRTLEVEGEDGESRQAVLAMGPLPKTSEYPGNAELLFAPLESLDFPVDAVAHVKWIANKTMQTKADNAVKDARNAIEDAAARMLDHQTARRIHEARNVQHYYATEPYPPGLDVCTSLAVGARTRRNSRRASSGCGAPTAPCASTSPTPCRPRCTATTSCAPTAPRCATTAACSRASNSPP
jgi:hypothetical protein